MSDLPPNLQQQRRLKRALMRFFYPYGRRKGGLQLIKCDLKQLSKDLPAGAARAATGIQFETAREQRLREFRNLIRIGYSVENAMLRSGVSDEDLISAIPPPTPRRDEQIPSMPPRDDQPPKR